MLELLLAQVLSFAPTPRTIVAPAEQMIELPAFPHLGKSRKSSIQFCEQVVGKNYANLITDSDFSTFEACLVDLT